ncbi:MAG: septal ring lytic transglycosylase RlpA family protein [Balneolaceae bacterium]|nr:septal ring lytic transglycosylase RlpA family protein [Balneolaceae bacterium]
MAPYRTFLPVLLVLSILLSGCGLTSRLERETERRPDSPGDGAADAREVSGLRPGAMIEEGVASWYGPNFHGKLTANGEEYDMHGLTAAHRTLPFNTLVRVRNTDNGETVTVRINDRGPYAKNRVIDLSRGAAEEIGMIGPGTAPVELFLVEGDLSRSRITDLTRPTYTVQLGSFSTEQQAFALSRKVQGSRVEEASVGGQTLWRVYYGTYVDRGKAESKRRELSGRGVQGYVKQLENSAPEP